MFVKEIDAGELSALLMDGEQVRLIDVRTPAEVARGTIPGAENLPLHTLPLRTQEVADSGKVIFYCRTGARSAQACMFMAGQGHDQCYNLRGGIMSWAREGQSIAQAMAG